MDVFHIYTQGTSVLKIQNVQKSNTLEHNQENVITTMTWVGGGGGAMNIEYCRRTKTYEIHTFTSKFTLS